MNFCRTHQWHFLRTFVTKAPKILLCWAPTEPDPYSLFRITWGLIFLNVSILLCTVDGWKSYKCIGVMYAQWCMSVSILDSLYYYSNTCSHISGMFIATDGFRIFLLCSLFCHARVCGYRNDEAGVCQCANLKTNTIRLLQGYVVSTTPNTNSL